MVQFTGELQ